MMEICVDQLRSTGNDNLPTRHVVSKRVCRIDLVRLTCDDPSLKLYEYKEIQVLDVHIHNFTWHKGVIECKINVPVVSRLSTYLGTVHTFRGFKSR